MALTIQKESIPLETDKHGAIRVGGTRVTLDTLVAAYKRGATAEEIMQQYPSLKLVDIYFAIGYYLRWQEEVEAYLKEREQRADEVRRLYATPVDLQMLRDRLAARKGDARPPNNLPHQLTSFIGREREIEEVRRLLMSSRLLTLTGAGGSGKTRLALEVASGLLDSYPDGIFFVNLAPITDPGLVTSAIANALDVRESAGHPLLDALKSYLQDKQVLLLLDNFEQVLEAAPLVVDLLLSTPYLKVLATSREPLNLQGEQQYQVPPLSCPTSRSSWQPRTCLNMRP